MKGKEPQECRICADITSNYVPIFNKDATVFNKITRCLPITVRLNDGLPSNICLSCSNALSISYALSNLSVRNDISRRELLSGKSSLSHTEPIQSPEPTTPIGPKIQSVNSHMPDDSEAKNAKQARVHHISEAPAIHRDCNYYFTESIQIKEDIVDDEIRNGTCLEEPGYADEPSNQPTVMQGQMDIEETPTIINIKTEVGVKTEVFVNEVPKQKMCDKCERPYGNNVFFGQKPKHVRSQMRMGLACYQCGKEYDTIADNSNMSSNESQRYHFRRSTENTRKSHESEDRHGKTMEIKSSGSIKISKSQLRRIRASQIAASSSLSCVLCSKRCENKHRLRVHMLYHLPKSNWKYECAKCNEKFPLAIGLKRHIAAGHFRPRSITCNVCDRKFLNRSHLTNHQKIH